MGGKDLERGAVAQGGVQPTRQPTTRPSPESRNPSKRGREPGAIHIEHAPRRPLRRPADALGPKLAELAHLDEAERALVLGVIDAVTTKAKLGAITSTAS